MYSCSFISLAFGLSLVFTAVQFGNSACSSSLEEEKRVDCHPGPDATMDKCRCKGCQWCTATKSGVPYCFHNSDSTVLSQGSWRNFLESIFIKLFVYLCFSIHQWVFESNVNPAHSAKNALIVIQMQEQWRLVVLQEVACGVRMERPENHGVSTEEQIWVK